MLPSIYLVLNGCVALVKACTVLAVTNCCTQRLRRCSTYSPRLRRCSTYYVEKCPHLFLWKGRLPPVQGVSVGVSTVSAGTVGPDVFGADSVLRNSQCGLIPRSGANASSHTDARNAVPSIDDVEAWMRFPAGSIFMAYTFCESPVKLSLSLS